MARKKLSEADENWERAKTEWLKQHPEDKEKLDNIYKPQMKQPQLNQRDDEKNISSRQWGDMFFGFGRFVDCLV